MQAKDCDDFSSAHIGKVSATNGSFEAGGEDPSRERSHKEPDFGGGGGSGGGGGGGGGEWIIKGLTLIPFYRETKKSVWILKS